MHPFLWKNGTMIDLGTLGGTFAAAQCVNNQGQVIGQSNLTGDVDQHAFLWEQGTMKDLGTLGGSFSTALWLNNQGEAVGGATTTGDALFHATLWRNGVISDLGALPGDCFSLAFAINSEGQAVGESFNCDTNTLRSVLWDKGSIIELDAAIPSNSNLQLRETFNINDRGEIVGEGFPVDCNDVNVCGHSFLLIPCDPAAGQECSPVTATQSHAALLNNQSTTSTQRRITPIQGLAAWRARLAQRYHLSGVPAPKD
jgi:probable HAF family extracellular repeat protein